MRILLVNPTMSRLELYSDWDMSDVKSESPPIGLLSVAAYARSKGHKVSFHEPFPDVIAITAMTIQISTAAKLANEYKKQYPTAKTVLGGSHVTSRPQETLRRYPQFDFGIVGEGEIVFNQLLDALSGQGDVRSVPSLIYRERDLIHHNPRAELIENLDDLPYPAYDLIPSLFNDYKLSIFGTKSKKSVGLVTSRGCPGQCTFCDRSVFGRKFRGHSAEYIIDLMDDLHDRFGVNDFLFFDDLFVANRPRLKRFCELMKWRSYTWSCCARADYIDKTMLPDMKRAGCWMIEYGIESGNEEVLKLMKKNIKKETIYETIKATEDAGIESKGNFIFGNIGETLESLRESVNFACELPIRYFQHTFLAPLPGSEIWDTAGDHGEFVRDWSGCNTFSINFVPRGLSREKLKDVSRYAWLRFYLRPKIIFKEIKKLKDWESFERLLVAIKAFLKTVFR